MLVGAGDSSSQQWTFASCHFTWDGAAKEREHHVALLEPEFSGKQRFVLGGDWNAAGGQPSSSLRVLQERTWLGRHGEHVPLRPPPRGTHFKEQESAVIDHFFVSSDVRIGARAKALKEPSCPYGDGSPAAVVGASDHVPILLQVSP